MALFTDPIDRLLRLQRDISRFSGKPLVDFGLSGASVFPQINVFSKEDGSLVLKAEVPGIAPGDLDVDIEARRLTIAGERPANDTQGGLHRRERGVGKFSRSVQLPADLAIDEASATIRNGVLTVAIPKRAEAQSRRITVEAA